MGIHEQITSTLHEIGIKYLFGRKNLDLRYRNYRKYLAFKIKKDKWTKNNADFILYLIGNWMRTENFSDLLYELGKKNLGHCQNIILLNGKRNELFNQFPENVRIIHKYKNNQIIPKKRTYKKANMYNALIEMCNDVSNLPYQPLEIHGYGSFFRDKERIGDVDLRFKHDEEHPRWKRFYAFFSEQRKNYFEFIDFIYDEYNNERRKVTRRIPSLLKKYSEETFREQVERFGVDVEILQYCTWSELLGDDTLGFFYPNIDTIFLRMFKKNKRGFETHPSSKGLKDGKNYILLWSRENPSFETNYKTWKENNKKSYLRKENSHLVEDLDKWIKAFDQKGILYISNDEIKEYAIKEYTKLKSEFPLELEDNITNEALSERITILREKMKLILAEVDKMGKKFQLDKTIGWREFLDRKR